MDRPPIRCLTANNLEFFEACIQYTICPSATLNLEIRFIISIL